jgi:hypothetical protein
MKKFVNEMNVNLMILPLTPDQAGSLEDYLTEVIALPRDNEEFVVVLGEDEISKAVDGHSLNGFSWLSYGRYDKARFSDKEKIEIEELLFDYGRQWLKNNDVEILESIRQS